MYAPISTFSLTVRAGKSAFDCGTCETPIERMREGCSPQSDSPSSRTSPLRGSSRPLTARSTVDLPAPFGPTMQHTEPAGTSSPTPWRTSPPPYPAYTSVSVSISGLHRLLEAEVLAEVGVEDLGVALDVVRRSARDRLPAGEHQDRIAEAEHERHVVLDDQECLAGRVQLADHLADPLDQGRIDAAGRLVEHDQLRVEHQDLRELQQLLLAVAERGRPHVAILAHA